MTSSGHGLELPTFFLRTVYDFVKKYTDVCEGVTYVRDVFDDHLMDTFKALNIFNIRLELVLILGVLCE